MSGSDMQPEFFSVTDALSLRVKVTQDLKVSCVCAVPLINGCTKLQLRLGCLRQANALKFVSRGHSDPVLLLQPHLAHVTHKHLLVRRNSFRAVIHESRTEQCSILPGLIKAQIQQITTFYINNELIN